MKKIGVIVTAALLSVAALSGCTKSNIVTPDTRVEQGAQSPDFETKEDIEIDWDDALASLRDEFIEPYGTYGDYVMDMRLNYDVDSETVNVILPVTGKTTSEIAVSYGEDVLRFLGDEMATQDFSYEPSSEDEDTIYYGSFFDTHNAKVQVFVYNEEGNEDAYLVNDTIKAGEQRALQAQ